MTRIMIDAIGANAQAVSRAFPHADMIAWYGTGTTDVRWTYAERMLFHGSEMVEIDQGYQSPSITTATVRDVEQGAWTLPDAVRLDNWPAERPTIYCSRATLPALITAGWKGDVWLAYPGYSSPSPPDIPPFRCIAVQHSYTTMCDISTVYDDAWPYKRQENTDMLTQQIPPLEKAFIPFPSGSFHALYLYRDFLSPLNRVSVRLAVHSASKGYHVEEITLSTPNPVGYHFTESDVDGVSIVLNTPEFGIGVTLA